MTDRLEDLIAGNDVLQDQLRDLDRLADSFSYKLAKGLSDVIVKGKDVDDVLRSVAMSLSQMALRQAIAPVGNLISTGLNSLVSGLGGVASSALGGGAPVNVSISTPDIVGFQRAENQVAATLARAVQRGQRGL
jgi:hypothetical protein